MCEENVFHARRTPVQMEVAPYPLGMMQSYTKRALFVTEGRFRWWEWRSVYFEDHQNERKGHLFLPEGRLHWWEGRHIRLEWRLLVRKGRLSC